MATTAVASGPACRAAPDAASQGLRHKQLSIEFGVEALRERNLIPQTLCPHRTRLRRRARVAAGRDSPEQLDDRTAGSARLGAPEERTGAG